MRKSNGTAPAAAGPRATARSLVAGLVLGSVGCGGPSAAGDGDAGALAADLVATADLTAGPLTDLTIAADIASALDLAGNDTWRWIDVADSVCANGKSTGIGVNLTNRSTDLVIVMQGGGACWEADACAGFPSADTVPAHFVTGYDAATFASEQLVFDRTDPANPLRDASVVFVPYCTGDLFTGDRVTKYATSQLAQLSGKPAFFTAHHKGAANMAAFARVMAPMFPGRRRVFLVGVSAGGYGAQFNYPLVAGGLPAAEVHLLADSAQLVQPLNGILGTMTASWNLQVPAGCGGCGASFPALADFLFKSYPDRRFALLGYDQDMVLRLFFGYLLDPLAFKAATTSLLAGSYEPTRNARYFLLPGTGHTLLGGLGKTVSPGGIPLSTWVGWWVSGDPRWANAK